MAVTALAGCGSKAEGTADTAAKAQAEAGDAAESGDTVDVEFWYSGGKTAVNVLSDLVEEFNKSQDKYEIKGTTQAGLYRDIRKNFKQALRGKTHRIWRFLTWINPEICIVRIKWQI